MCRFILALGLLLFLGACYTDNDGRREQGLSDTRNPLRAPWYDRNVIPQPEVTDDITNKVITYRYFFETRPDVKHSSKRASVSIDQFNVDEKITYILIISFGNQDTDGDPIYVNVQVDEYNMLLRYEMNGTRFIYDMDTDLPYIDSESLDINLDDAEKQPQ